MGGIVAITSTSKNMTAAQAAAYNNNSQQDMRWWVGGAPQSLMDAVQQVPNVDAVELRATYYTKYYAAGAWRDMLFNGIHDFSDMHVNSVDLVRGTMARTRRGGAEIVGAGRCARADRRRASIQGGRREPDEHLTVVGFAKSPSYPARPSSARPWRIPSDDEVQKMCDGRR